MPPPVVPGALASTVEGRGKYLRPTSVRGRPYAGQVVAIEVIGLRDSMLIPQQLRGTYERMMLRLQKEMQAACRAVVPGGENGRLARQVHARRVGHTRIVVGTIGSQFARALNRGFTSTAKTAKALRFEESGTPVFTHRVKVAGRHFYEKWLVITPPIVEAVYDTSFYNIKDLL